MGQEPLIQPAGGGRPFWRRWWVMLVLGLLIAAGVAAVIDQRDDEAGEETAEPTPTAASAVTADDAPDTDTDIGPTTTSAAPPEAEQPTGQPAPDDEPDPAAERSVGTMDDPYALGETAVITLEAFGDADGSVWSLTVDEPGADITEAVLAANEFNDPPRDGDLYYGVPITLTLQVAGKEPLSTFINIAPEYLLPNSRRVVGNRPENGCGFLPDGFDWLQEVFIGGSISGYLCYSVPTDEAEAGIVLTIDDIEGGRIFLATEPGVGSPSPDVVPDPPTPPEPGSGPAGARSNPFPIGEPARITLDSFGDADGSRWTLAVTGAGADITDDVLAANQFNDPPPDGHVFYGVPVSLTLDEAAKEPLSIAGNTALEFFAPSSLQIISSGLAEGCGVVPDDVDPFEEVFAGGTITGVVCYAVAVDDVAAGVLLTVDELDEGRLFFATSP